MDFDELDELIDAFDFISSLANELRAQERDYTEVTYATKDNARFGFYQKEGEQQAFVVLSVTGASVFASVERLTSLKELLLTARGHLTSRGASDV